MQPPPAPMPSADDDATTVQDGDYSYLDDIDENEMNVNVDDIKTFCKKLAKVFYYITNYHILNPSTKTMYNTQIPNLLENITTNVTSISIATYISENAKNGVQITTENVMQYALNDDNDDKYTDDHVANIAKYILCNKDWNDDVTNGNSYFINQIKNKLKECASRVQLLQKAIKTASSAGGAAKKHVVYNKRKYAVRKDGRRSYIICKKTKVYLSDIRGKYTQS